MSELSLNALAVSTGPCPHPPSLGSLSHRWQLDSGLAALQEMEWSERSWPWGTGDPGHTPISFSAAVIASCTQS